MKLNPQSFKYVHFRGVYPVIINGKQKFRLAAQGGMTLAYTEEVEDGQVITYAAIALCHTNDWYQKKLGATKAKGRLLQAAAHDWRSGVKVNGEDISVTQEMDRWYVMPGPVNVTLHELIGELVSVTGYQPIKHHE